MQGLCNSTTVESWKVEAERDGAAERSVSDPEKGSGEGANRRNGKTKNESRIRKILLLCFGRKENDCEREGREVWSPRLSLFSNM